MTIRIHPGAFYLAAFAIAGILLWQHTTHSEFLWFVAGNVIGIVWFATCVIVYAKRHPDGPQATAKEATGE